MSGLSLMHTHLLTYVEKISPGSRVGTPHSIRRWERSMVL